MSRIVKSTFSKAKFLDSLRRQCSRREYCTADILKKIRDAYRRADSADCSLSEAEGEILAMLIQECYVSDLRYATAFARDKASLSGWGPAKIRYMLLGKGICRQDVDEALAEIDSATAETRLKKLVEAKFRSLKDDPQCRMKILRFALGRGYSYDEAADVIDNVMRDR